MEFSALEALIADYLGNETQLSGEFCCSTAEVEACERRAQELVQAARNEAARHEPTRQLESVKHFIRWGIDGWFEGEDVEMLGDALKTMKAKPVSEWTCCPLCAEIVCDDNCPLYIVRDEAGLWVGSSGA